MPDERNIAGVRPIPALDCDDEDVRELISLIRDAGYTASKHPEEELWTVKVDYEDSEAF